jgi:hypothetical protein
MDPLRFDRLTLTLAKRINRRRFAGIVAVLGAHALAASPSPSRAKREKKKKKAAGCVPASCAGKACGASVGCGIVCQTGSCPANQTCQNGQCVPVSACGPSDCGLPGDYNDLILVNGRCQCKVRGFGYNENSGPVGICQRNAGCAAFCAQCCGDARDLGDPCGPPNADYVCLAREGSFGTCGCPPQTPDVCLGSGAPRCSRDFDTDNEACGPYCEDCTRGGTATGGACCNGQCVGLLGCSPGSGGCTGYCGSCSVQCGVDDFADKPTCCNTKSGADRRPGDAYCTALATCPDVD